MQLRLHEGILRANSSKILYCMCMYFIHSWPGKHHLQLVCYKSGGVHNINLAMAWVSRIF